MIAFMICISCRHRNLVYDDKFPAKKLDTICIDSFAKIFYPNSIMLSRSIDSFLVLNSLAIDTSCADSLSIDKACIIIGLKLFYYQLSHAHQSYNLLDMIDDNSSFIIYRLITIRDKSAYPDPLSGESERYFPSFMPMDYVCNNLILLNNNEINIYYNKINFITDSLNASH